MVTTLMIWICQPLFLNMQSYKCMFKPIYLKLCGPLMGTSNSTNNLGCWITLGIVIHLAIANHEDRHFKFQNWCSDRTMKGVKENNVFLFKRLHGPSQ